MEVCLYEDRAANLVGVKLLILSLARHEPHWTIRLFAPDAPAPFRAWASTRANVRPNYDPVAGADGWNVKPRLLRQLLEEGRDRLLWLDSDLIASAALPSILKNSSAETLIVAEEEPWQRFAGSLYRTPSWGLDRGRTVATSVNSCVVRVSHHHYELMKDWEELLARPDYQQMQQLPWHERPFTMIGDQDALCALVGSRKYSGLQVRFLRQGRDVAHCFNEDGYTCGDRLHHAFRGLPALLHAQGEKPWKQGAGRKLHLELSPYSYAAAVYANDLDPSERSWIYPHSRTGRLLSFTALGEPNLAGFIPAMLRTTYRRTGRTAMGLVRAILRRSIAPRLPGASEEKTSFRLRNITQSRFPPASISTVRQMESDKR
jgi:hypothetical protein